MSDYSSLTIKELNAGLKAKQFFVKELIDFYLVRIKDYDDKLKTYLTVTEEAALRAASARTTDKQASSLLAGIPAGIKDVIVTSGVRSTGGSKILDNYIPPFDATAVKKLKDAGYVLLGKHNCDEFAQGASTEFSGFGPSYNPWDLTRVPGGSSGGSAAAVAAGLCHYALGTDTGGSVRQPASYCGVVGFKPTYGRVSRYGLMAMASSLDQVGILARRIEDVEDVLSIIEGEDPLDATSSESGNQINKVKRMKSLRGVQVGVPKEFFGEGLDGEVKKNIDQAIKELEKLGAEIKEISLPSFEYALATYYIICPAEVSSNMARYDGIRYGVSQQKTNNKRQTNLEDLYKANRSLLGEEVRRRIMLGTYVLSAGYYDEYYAKAQQVRQLVVDDFKKAFSEVDIIAGPVTPTPAFKLGEKTTDPLAMYLTDIYTVPVNLAGLPALSIPAGFVSGAKSAEAPTGRGEGESVPAGFVEVDNKKLPVGLHLIGKWWEDHKLLDIARVFEEATGYYKEKPEL